MLCAGVWCRWWCGTRPGTVLGRSIHKVGGLWVPESKPPVFIFFLIKERDGKTPEQSKLRKPESWLKNTQWKKTKYMTNHADSEDILIDQQKIEKVTEFKYLGQTTHLKDTTKEEIYARIRAAWNCFGKNKEILQDKQLPISLKKQVMDQCILPTMTYGCQTWSLNK